MRLIDVETLKLKEFVGDKVPPYAILSHTWGADEEEVSFRDIRRANIEKAGNGYTKLEGCCKQAKKDGLKYAWIDTCCIDKDSSTELGEAINSMFQWYKKASICYVYLSDVPTGDKSRNPGSKFFSSYWFTRGWTLQELLAPKKLQFYDQTWTLLGTKSELSGVIQTITHIPRPFLLGLAELPEASVAQRMSWAANRATKRTEDTAYCLLGIFGVVMPIIYGGDGNQAFSRLQQEIMKDTRDYSILAWGLDLGESIPSQSTDVISGGALATAPSDFANCGHIVPGKQYTRPVNAFEISGGCLRVHLPLHTTSTGEIYGLLNCGPEQNAEHVGIPLSNAISGEQSDEYIRPQGHHSILLRTNTSSSSTTAVYIRIERARAATNRRYWFYIEESVETNLELIEVYPGARWKDRAMISTATDSDRNITQRSLARFRRKGEESRDVIVVLEFEVQGAQVQARHHVMISSKDTSLEDLSQKLVYMRQEALGRQSASDGRLSVVVTVKQETVAGQPMFAVRLAPMPSSPAATIDVTSELQQLDLKLEFVSILQEEDKIRPEAERLDQQRDKKIATLESMRERLAAVQESIKNLSEEERLLIDGLEKRVQEADQLIVRGSKIRQRQDILSERGSEIQQGLDELLRSGFDTTKAPDWFEAIIKKLLDAGKIDVELKDIGDHDSNLTHLPRVAESGNDTCSQTPLLWAAMNGRQAILKKLLEDGVDLESKDEKHGRTPLSWAILNGHEAVVKLLLEKDADLESKDEEGGWTPLSLAAQKGHKAVVKLLLEKGADLESKDKHGRTPLSSAALNGHEAVVNLLLDKYGSHHEDSSTSKSKSSINNPKLLDTVEDAIRHLILPELATLKREQSKPAQRDRDRRGLATSGSTKDIRKRSSSTRGLSTHKSKSRSASHEMGGGPDKSSKGRWEYEDPPGTFEREASEEVVL
jgi:hypothetical protein